MKQGRWGSLSLRNLSACKNYMHLNDTLIQKQKRKFSPGDNVPFANQSGGRKSRTEFREPIKGKPRMGSGALDITMNIQGTEVERGYSRPILNTFHACFSVGSLVSALLVSTLAALNVSPAWSVCSRTKASRERQEPHRRERQRQALMDHRPARTRLDWPPALATICSFRRPPCCWTSSTATLAWLTRLIISWCKNTPGSVPRQKRYKKNVRSSVAASTNGRL